MPRLYLPVLVLAATWLGARLPLDDLGFLDLARGRTIASTWEWSARSFAKIADAQGEPGWLGSLLLYQAHRAAAEMGVRALAGLLVAGGVTLLYSTFPGGAAFLLTLAALIPLHGTFEVSADLFAWPLFAACVLCLRGLPPPGLRRLIFMPLVLAAWPHLCAGVILGLGLLGLAVLVAIARRLSRRATSSDVSLWKLCLIAALAGALLFASPGGLEAIDNPLDPLVRAALLQKAERTLWRPVRLEGDAVFLLLAALAGALAGFSAHVSLAEALAMVVLLCLTGFSRHFAPFFLATAIPLAAPSLGAVGTRFARALGRLGRARPALLLSAGLALWLPRALTAPPPHPFRQAVAELEGARPAGPLFNVPEVGGLIAWSQPAGLSPSTDLRPRSLRAFDARMKEDLSRLLEEPGVGIALFSRHFALAHAGDLRRLAPGLSAMYFDDDALIYVDGRRNPQLREQKGLRRFDPLLPVEAYADAAVPAVTRELVGYLDAHPPFATGLVSLGGLLRRTGDKEQALEVFEAARRIAPEDPVILNTLSELYLEKGMYRLAEGASRASLGRSGDAASLHRLGVALYGQGRYAEAARCFEKELAGYGESMKARRALAEAYERLGRASESAQEKKRVAALEKAAVAAATAEAEQQARILDFAGAARAYQRATELRPGDTHLLWQLALTLLTQERRAEAGQTLSQLLRVEPRHAEAQLVRGVLCARWLACRPGEARAHLERFLELAPGDPNAELARAELAELERRVKPRVK